jgi:hypothetical protein
MFKLFKNTILKRQLIMILLLFIVLVIEDIALYKRPMFSFLLLAIIPQQFILYLDISSASYFVAVSPRFNNFQRKKYMILQLLFSTIPYLLFSGIYLLFDKNKSVMVSAGFNYPIFLGCTLGFSLISFTFLYKIQKPFIITFVLCLIFSLLYSCLNNESGSFIQSWLLKNFSGKTLPSLAVGLMILVVLNLAAMILHNILLKYPVTTNNYYVGRYYKILNK